MEPYLRKDMGGWHLRVVIDRVRTVAYLTRTWPHLPASFFHWLMTAEPGATYRLEAYVFDPELWVMRDAPDMGTDVSESQPSLVQVA